MHQERLNKLKEILRDKKIDYFILPNSDQFFLEYLPASEKRIEFLSGFSGSNAIIIISANSKNIFFTDGRYTLQAQNEIDSDDYEIFNMAEKPVLSWLQENVKNLAIDINLSNLFFVKKLEELKINLIKLDKNPVDDIWLDRPASANSKVFFHELKYSGVSSIKKRKQITKDLKEDAVFLNSPESVCWLLNLRASDIEYTPIMAANAILYKDNSVDLFIDEKRIDRETKSKLEKVNIIFPNALESRLKEIAKKIQIDANSINYFIYDLLQKNNFEIVEKQDPCLILKAIKNKTEIKNAVKAHEIDGLAVTKFLAWIEENQDIDELTAEEKLLEFRRQNKNFLYPSFHSISSFGANGAIIHYRSTDKTNKKFAPGSLYLIDSGGQYPLGTTDITRVVAIGEPTNEMKENFTLVLKGHIALATAEFKEGTTGDQLDKLARQFLQERGKDYDHGTGHGVGSFLSVHEGPCSISKRSNKQELLSGIILSNEPGYYKANAYGIRIENLILVKKTWKKTLKFQNLTFTPIDFNLIDEKLLTKAEKNYLKIYHENIFSLYKNKVDAVTKAYLARLVECYKKIKN